ncbi:MAG: DUF2782 domain-containing protein [Gammaproteobacteria bacterium]|nr:DUF2782 domain-containing protein [Gammaproteobacteria bacterium]
MKSFHAWLLMAAIFSSASTWAADPVEPSIVIRHSEDKTYYEYSINGEVREIKVVPKVGPVYYLVPVGEDNEEFKRQTQSNLVVPKWVIFRW